MRLSKPGTSLGRIGLFVFVFVAPVLAFPLVSQQQVPEPHLLSMGKAEQLLREGKPTEAVCTPEEQDYLCAFASRYFDKPVTRDDIVWTYSGVRPLYDDGASSATAATTRPSLSRAAALSL